MTFAFRSAALLVRCFAEERHLSPYMLVVVDEQLVLSVRTLVPALLPNSSGENYILLKVSAFPLFPFNSLITCYGSLQRQPKILLSPLPDPMYLSLC